MDSLESIVVGQNGCTFKEIVNVFVYEVNSVTVLNTWTNFARELSIESLQIEEWRQEKLLNKLTLKDVLHRIIESWRREKGNDATLSELLKHLENVNLRNIADDVRSYFAMRNRVHKGGTILRLTLPKKSKYYIPRTVITRRVIEEKVFSSTLCDIFVIYGIDRFRLSQLAEEELTDTSTSQVGKHELSTRFILLQHFGDWALLCGKTTNPIHLIRHHGGRFHWVCTNGDISALQQTCDEKDRIELTEEEFIEKIETDLQFQANQPICISDSPGMGKSLLLANIGRQLQHRYPQRSIVFIVISEFVVKLSELLPEFHNTEEALLEAILRLLCVNDSQQEHLVHKLRTNPTVNISTQFELMFDGFDEVSNEYVELAHECLEILAANFNNTVRVWITTRPQHLHELERRLSVLGFQIQAFQEEHQIAFLTAFWNSQQNNLDEVKLETFSKNCLRTLKKKFNKKDEDIAGIPLQCMMIAEVYSHDAYRFCDSKNEKLENCLEAAPSIFINSITDLYEKMIYHKIEKFIRTYKVMEEQINSILPWHMYLALELVFPSHFHKFKETLNIGSRLTKDDFANIGILEIRGTATKDPARFIHRTFAEYLAAHYFFSYEIAHSTANLKNASRVLPNFLFKHMLECSVKKCKSTESGMYYQCWFTHSVLCHFFDALLSSRANISTENCICQKSTNYTKRIIYACIHSDFGNIIKFLRSLKYPDGLCMGYLHSEILIDATTIASLELLQLLLRNYGHEPLTAIEKNPDLLTVVYELPNITTALHAAVRRGSYTLFEYILKEHDFEDLVKEDEEERFQDLVRCAVENTVDRDIDEIQDRIQILSALCNLNRERINYCHHSSNRTPLLANSVHIELLKKLIECGANLLHVDVIKNTILHKATIYLSPNDYYNLLQCIPSTTLIALLKKHNDKDEHILHLILQRGFATPDILNLILSNGVDINARDKSGYTCIFHALKMKNKYMRIPTVKLLLEKGADPAHISSDGNSAVHYSAMNGQIDCLRFFLEEMNMDVNQINKDGNTPLFLALRSWDSALKTVQFLLEQGADYKILNSRRCSLLHYSSLYHQLECLQLFLNLGGLDINQADDNGNTPLFCCIWINKHGVKTVEIIRLLLDKGADHTILNKNGYNVLHNSAERGNSVCFHQFAGLPSLEVNAKNCNGDTPLHLFCMNIRNYVRRQDDCNSFLHIIEKLLSLGADVNAKNEDGETPLDIYEEEILKCKDEELMTKHVTIRRLLETKKIAKKKITFRPRLALMGFLGLGFLGFLSWGFYKKPTRFRFFGFFFKIQK